MEIIVLGDRARYERYMPGFVKELSARIAYYAADTPVSSIIHASSNAEALLADAIFPVPRELIEGLPRLKLIHSDGVGYNGIDIEAARERGVFVCNCKGCNAAPVAEVAVMLMLMLARLAVPGRKAVLEGRQIEYKEEIMRSGAIEFASLSVGLVGLGAIGAETAKRLIPFGNKVFYYAPHRRPAEREAELNVSFLPLNELAASCDIVSLHCAVTSETQGMVNADFLSKMKRGSYLVNTSRGQLIDNMAVREALLSGRLAGAAFDTLYPEPTPADHPLVALPEDALDRVVYLPHLGGNTGPAFTRAYACVWENVRRVMEGMRPINVVNGL